MKLDPPNLRCHPAPIHLHAHQGSDRISIGPDPHAPQQQPVLARTEILEQARPVPDVADDDLQRPVVVEISRRGASRRPRLANARTRRTGDLLEAAADIPVELPRLSVLISGKALGFGIDVPVHHEQIAETIVIHVGEMDAPADVLHVRAEP